MKALKKTTLLIASMSKGSSKKEIDKPRPRYIRLKTVTDEERQHLRVQSYKYLLP